jgi:endonuclease G
LKTINLFLFSVFLLLVTGCGDSSEQLIRDESTTGIKSKFMNETVCDVIIDKEFLEICYDNELKAAKSVAYSLDGDLVNELNINERPYFYEEESVASRYRAHYSDYTNSGYDRGHMAPDAAFDWSAESLEATYSLANIIPQIPEVNQQMWVDVEGYARTKAVELGRVNILNIVKYNTTPNRIGTNGIAVSEGFFKVLYNEDDGYEECYYYANEPNDNSLSDKLATHLVDCSTILN